MPALPESPSRSIPLPPTKKQILYARQLALETNTPLPWNVQQERRALSHWIDDRKSAISGSDAARRPTSKQVAFAERIARIKRTAVPEECFRDRHTMSRWIDLNRP